MTTSGLYAYNPGAGALSVTAFGRCGIRRTEITSQHIADAADEANLLLVDWSNRQCNLWTANTYTVTLIAGTSAYTLPANTVDLMIVYMTTTVGTSTDRVLFPLSTFEYGALPNKTQQAPPTSYWFDRQITPILNLWPVPDSAATYTINVRMVRQAQDTSLPSGTNVNLPYRWLDAYVAGLAARLSAMYAPDRAIALDAKAKEAWTVAATQDVEQVPMFIIPGLNSYYRS